MRLTVSHFCSYCVSYFVSHCSSYSVLHCSSYWVSYLVSHFCSYLVSHCCSYSGQKEIYYIHWIIRWNLTNIWCLSDVYLTCRRYYTRQCHLFSWFLESSFSKWISMWNFIQKCFCDFSHAKIVGGSSHWLLPPTIFVRLKSQKQFWIKLKFVAHS